MVTVVIDGREIAEPFITARETHVQLVREADIVQGLVPPVHIGVFKRVLARAECIQLQSAVAGSQPVIGQGRVQRSGIGVCVGKLRCPKLGVHPEGVVHVDLQVLVLASLGRDHHHAVGTTHTIERSGRRILQDVARFNLQSGNLANIPGESVHQDQWRVSVDGKRRNVVNGGTGALRDIQSGNLSIQGLTDINIRRFLKCRRIHPGNGVSACRRRNL